MAKLVIFQKVADNAALAVNDPWLDATTADATYLRLDATNDPLTGTLSSQAILPSADATYDLGTTAARFDTLFGTNVNIQRGGSAAPSAQGNVLINQNGSVAPSVTAVAGATVIGGTYGSNGTMYLQAQQAGSFVAGLAQTYGNYIATLQANGYAAVTFGNAYAVYGNATVSAANNGAFSFGYARGYYGTALVTAAGFGTFVFGRANANAANTATLTSGATSYGSMTHGDAVSTTNNTGLLQATGVGSHAHGRAQGGTITASNHGSQAGGEARSGNTLLSSGIGAIAHGRTGTAAGYGITASGQGAVAIGLANTAAVVASASNSAQFFPGTNATADTFQIGSAGLRLKGTSGAPAVLQNGDIWVANNYVYIRSNGVSCQVVNAIL